MDNSLYTLKNLVLKRGKIRMPYMEPIATNDHCVFICGKTPSKAVIDLKANSNINSSSYRHYYIDFRYIWKIKNKTVKLDIKKEKDIRENLYKEIDKGKYNLDTVISLTSLNLRNVFVDLSKWNDLFFSNTNEMSYMIRIEEYLKLLKDKINDERFKEYKHRFVMIDAEEWLSGLKNISGINKKDINNPILIFSYLLKNDLELLKSIGDINFFIYSDSGIFRMNPSECDKGSFAIFNKSVNSLSKGFVTYEELDNAIKNSDSKSDAINKVAKKVTNMNDSDDSEEDVKNTAIDIATSTIDELEDDDTEYDSLLDEVELANQVNDSLQQRKVGRSTASIKRDEELREKQKTIKLDDSTIGEITKTKNVLLTPKTIKNPTIHSVNEDMLDVTFPSFEKEYNDKLMEHDIVSVFSSLNDKDLPVFIKEITEEDTSDNLNFKKTMRVVLEDGNRVRHTITVDIPTFMDDKFLYIGGNKKVINKQLMLKPISKTGEDRVQISTNYNKIFLSRYGTKFNSKTERLKKFFSNKTKSKIKVTLGNNSNTNMKYKSAMEYGELSKIFSTIETSNYIFNFNQEELEKKFPNVSSENGMIVGIYKKTNKPIIMDYDSQEIVGLGTDIVDTIVSEFTKEEADEFNKLSVGKKYMYTRATIMKKQVPLLLLVAYCEGLSTVLKKANVKYYFSDKRIQSLERNEKIVKFKDGYLIYKDTPFETSLLLNAFVDIPTEEYDFNEFDSKEIYYDIFELLFGVRNIANAFNTFYEFMIDPISKEVLQDLNQPTDFVGVLLYGNKLMADNSFIKENNMNLYRVRSNEVIAAFLYKAIARAYARYRDTSSNTNPVKISIPRNQIIKDLLELRTVEDYPTLNPIVELSKNRTVSYKGSSGLNLERAYTLEKRSYDSSMVGVIAMSTSPDANVGINKDLTLEPKIISARGYLDVNDDNVDELSSVNLFSPAELLTPIGNTRDDSVRIAMGVKQSKHIIPVKTMSPVLISNGAEQIIQYHLGTDFVNTAEEDGEVVEIHEETGIMIVKYKSGKHQAIDLYDNIVKNGGGGFFLSNKKITNLKPKDKFKAQDILAYDEKFFSTDSSGTNKFNLGTLQKVVAMPSFATYEDSSYVTKKMSNEMTSEIIAKKELVLGPNSNIDFIVKKGQKVNVGDDLIIYDQSFDEASMNKLLLNVSTDLQDDFKSIGKSNYTSKYSGTIEDVKIYCSVDLDELSPSLRKIVSGFYKSVNDKKKILKKYDPKAKGPMIADLFIPESAEKTEEINGKIKGFEVNGGVLIEFYIKYNNRVGVGDKVA